MARINFDCLEPLRVRQWVIEDIGIRDEPCVAVTKIFFGFAGQTAIGCPTVAQLTLFPSWRKRKSCNAWEQRKFSDLVLIERGGSPRPIDAYITEDPAGLNWVKIGDAPSMGRYITSTSEKIKSEGLSKTRQVYPGDLVLSNSMSFGRPYIMAVEGCIHDGWLLIRDTQNQFDPVFLCHMLGTSQMLDQYRMFASGSTVNNLNKELVGNAMVPLPNRDEQVKIGKYLDELDNLITLHQRKSISKTSFFVFAWEQRKFSNLTDRVSMQSSDPDLPQVEYEDIVSGEGTLNKDLRDKEGGKTGIKFYAGDVLYGKLRPYLMNWLYPQFNGVAVGDFWVLRATECDSSFLYRLVQTDSFQRLANVSSGSKMPRADWNLISQSFFAVPADYAEQRVIAKSLAELDNLITLHQCVSSLAKTN